MRDHIKFWISNGKGHFLVDDCPQDLRDMVYRVTEKFTGESFVHPWIMKTLFEAFSYLELNTMEELSRLDPDTSSDLLDWVKEDWAQEFCNVGLRLAFMENKWKISDMDIMAIIESGQTVARIYMYETVWNYMNGEIDE